MNDNGNTTDDCICYICQCNGGELIQPCTCAGLVHPVCMYNRKACKAGLWVAYAKSECHKQLIRVGGIENAFGDYKFTIGNADIYADPTEYKDGCCGHMINDGDGPVKRINNCIIKPLFGGLCLAIVTVAEIHKGEELLLPYGPTYWENKKLLNRAV